MNSDQSHSIKTVSHADRTLALTISVFLLPVWLINFIIAAFTGQSVLEKSINKSVLGDSIILRAFRFGLLVKSFYLWEVICGNISLFGAPLNTNLGCSLTRKSLPNPGLISNWQLHKIIGLAEHSLEDSIRYQSGLSQSKLIALLIKFSFAKILYSRSELEMPCSFSLFGIRINNVSMTEAINTIASKNDSQRTHVAYFVNVNSFNLAFKDNQFRRILQSGNSIFADGSGVRLASKFKGFGLKDNVNGTDMLPKLCSEAEKRNLSIYFLGAKPGIADLAAINLKKKYPFLRIAGTQHGYFEEKNNHQIINNINESDADILLLGFGSPIQESWLHHNSKHLNCTSALAVGGLFDFFSGKIPRAPYWMRELGLEWVWRLIQEPTKKFSRYVIGNPLFLYRLATTH